MAADTDTATANDRMVLRWTPEQRERAWAIVNDIAEDIDNGESRKELRQALAICADHLCDALQAKASKESTHMIEALGKLAAIMETQNDPSSATAATKRPD